MIAAGPAGAVLLPLFSQTGSQTVMGDVECCAASVLGKLPDNVIYTRDRQGRWKGKAGSHLPVIDVKKSGDKVTLNLKTRHGMSESHYIVRHTVVNGEGQVLGAKTFHWKDEPVSSYEIEIPSSGKARDLFVMSYCNLHDLWLVQTKLEV
ncbi:MAG TPA: hypothetical protein EYP14_02645 [Planctomycetaceae bacterium]|nr:hypothetical protein [Planctomycetaceae bacterium]